MGALPHATNGLPKSIQQRKTHAIQNKMVFAGDGVEFRLPLIPPKAAQMYANPQYRRKKTIQLVLGSLEYAQWLRALLEQDGEHHVHVVNQPDLRLGGVVVVDEESLERLSPILDPQRFVVFVRNGTDNIARIWGAGIRQVVFEGSSAESAHLTILAAELKVSNGPEA